MEKVERTDLVRLFERIASEMSEKAEELGQMDALLGDGDLGLTMKKGFCALPKMVEEWDDPDIGMTIAKAGMKLSAVAPSTMGFLMASGLMAGGKKIAGARAIGAVEYTAFLEGFAEGIAKRGKCRLGDRTVLDAFGTAAEAAKAYLQENPGASLCEVAEAAEAGAAAGVEATRGMIPRHGKAAVHKAAAAGAVDQGAYAGLCLISALRAFFSWK